LILCAIILLCNINEGTIFGLFPHLTNNIGLSIGLFGGVIGNLLFNTTIENLELYFFGFGNIFMVLLLVCYLL